MDNVSLAVLNKLCATTDIGRYAIISEEEFFDALPESETPCADLSRALSNLSDDGYIDIKYSGGDMYCLAPKKLPPVHPPEPTEITVSEVKTPPTIPEKTGFRQFLYSMLGGFLGAALGGILITILTAVF